MSLQTATIAFLQTTDAEFRQWGSDLTTLIANSGFTAYAQTGEADFATVTKPTAGNQQRWFKCYRWNDGLTELYLKLTGGSGNDAATQPEIGAQIGYALDGSGGFTGTQASARFGCRFNAASLATRVCKSGAAWKISVNDVYLLFGDRSRNGATGAADSAGGYLSVVNSGFSVPSSVSGFAAVGYHEYVASAGGTWGNVGYNNERWGMALPSFGGSYGRGGNFGVIPIMGWDAGWKAAQIAAVALGTTDFPTAGVNATVPMYGTNHSYRRTGVGCDSGTRTAFGLIDE